MTKDLILGLGNLYVETNYLGVETGGSDVFEMGKEYSAPSYEVRLGGSAVNFITQVNKFGLPTGIIGKCGDDDNAQSLFKLLEKEGIKTDLIKKSNKHSTNVDTGLVVAHTAQNVQIIAGNANQSLAIEDINLNSPIFESVKAIYFGGCFKQKNLWPKYPEIFKTLDAKGIQLYIDAGRVPVDADKDWINILKEIMPQTSGYFPNDMEVRAVTGRENIEEAINEIIDMGAKLVVVKLGPDGCVARNKDKTVTVPGIKVDAVNTVGAGDCFNASFITQIIKGKDIQEASQFANASAAFRVSRNYQPNTEEVEEFFKHI